MKPVSDAMVTQRFMKYSCIF